MAEDLNPTLQTLERLVGAGMSDSQIAHHLTQGRRTARWAKMERLKHRVMRRVGGAGRNAECIVDDPFDDPDDRSHWYERYRHGEITLDAIADYCGVSYPEIYHDWMAYYADVYDHALETPAARRARATITDCDVDIVAKCKSVFGRRLTTYSRGNVDMLLLDGERVTVAALVAAADIECLELGLPGIGRGGADG